MSGPTGAGSFRAAATRLDWHSCRQDHDLLLVRHIHLRGNRSSVLRRSHKDEYTQ